MSGAGTENSIKKHRRFRFNAAMFFLVPFTVGFAVFFLFPFFFGIIISFFRWNLADPTDIAWRGLLNYQKILFDSNSTFFQDFWSSLGSTFAAMIILTAVCMVVPFVLALLVNRKTLGYKVFRAIIYVPGIFSVSATGLMFLNLFNYQYGLINNMFSLSVNWLLNPPTAWIVILSFCVWGGIGTNFIIFSAGLKQIDSNLYEAASTDGCGRFRQIFAITLPSLKMQFTICLFTTMIGYMNLYGQNYILGAYVQPASSIYTVIYVIQNMLMGVRFEVYGMVSAMAICLGLFIGLISIVQVLFTSDKIKLKVGKRKE